MALKPLPFDEDLLKNGKASYQVSREVKVPWVRFKTTKVLCQTEAADIKCWSSIQRRAKPIVGTVKPRGKHVRRSYRRQARISCRGGRIRACKGTRSWLADQQNGGGATQVRSKDADTRSD